MNLVKGLLINLMLLLVTANAWALSGARLLGQSSSGQSALFNLGVHDGIKEGDYAVVLKEIRSLDVRDLKLVPVARAKNIKISTGQSVWIFYKIYNSELLVKGESYLLLTESQMLSGRRDPRLGRTSLITDKDKVALETQETLSHGKDQISKLKSQYPEIEQLHEGGYRSDNDIDLVDVEGWVKFKNDKYRTALYKSPHSDDFRKKLRLVTFEKLVTAYLKKINDPDFNYDQFYKDQMKSDDTNEFRKKSSLTEYEKMLLEQSHKKIEDEKLYQKILEKGANWPEDFSDEELKLVLNKVSTLQENKRRLDVMTDPRRYSVYFGAGLNLTDAQTEKDSGYRREGAYSVDLDLEATPFLKHETLERFTLNGSFRSNKTAFESENYNTRIDEISLSAGLNWYPLYPPHTIEAAVIFIGAFIRSGTASAESPSLGEKSNYTVLSLPGLRGGMKYNFKNKFGLRIAFSLEELQLNRYEQSQIVSALPDQNSLVEGKMNFALAYSF